MRGQKEGAHSNSAPFFPWNGSGQRSEASLQKWGTASLLREPEQNVPKSFVLLFASGPERGKRDRLGVEKDWKLSHRGEQKGSLGRSTEESLSQWPYKEASESMLEMQKYLRAWLASGASACLNSPSCAPILTEWGGQIPQRACLGALAIHGDQGWKITHRVGDWSWTPSCQSHFKDFQHQ